LTPIYVQGASLAVIAFDLSSPASWSSVQHWVDFLGENGQCQFVLIGTKSDLEVDEETIDTACAWSQQRNTEFIQTSAKSGDNIERSLRAVQRCAIAATARAVEPGVTVLRDAPQQDKCC
jgi:GTPase SAR1 family protein